jgi:hypothetical protein
MVTLIKIRSRFLFFRPVWWLMCPESKNSGSSFVVGEFRNHRLALLAQRRLVNELNILTKDTA